MSTENVTPQVGQQEEPVLMLDDKKYVISELNDEAKYYVACLNNLGMKKQNLQMDLDQITVASQGFTDRLKEVIDNPQEEPEVVEAEEAE